MIPAYPPDRRRIPLALLALGVLCIASSASAAAFSSDFGFVSGTPVSGNTVVGGITVTLTSTNTEPNTATSFRDTIAGGLPATVNLAFSAPVSEFELDIVAVRSDEAVSSFNIGLADTLTGDLVHTGGGAYTTSLTFPNDSGSGSLQWTGLNTTSVSWTITGPSNSALGVTGFALTPLPEPGTAALLSLAIAGVLFPKRRHG